MESFVSTPWVAIVCTIAKSACLNMHKFEPKDNPDIRALHDFCSSEKPRFFIHSLFLMALNGFSETKSVKRILREISITFNSFEGTLGTQEFVQTLEALHIPLSETFSLFSEFISVELQEQLMSFSKRDIEFHGKESDYVSSSLEISLSSFKSIPTTNREVFPSTHLRSWTSEFAQCFDSGRTSLSQIRKVYEMVLSDFEKFEESERTYILANSRAFSHDNIPLGLIDAMETAGEDFNLIFQVRSLVCEKITTRFNMIFSLDEQASISEFCLVRLLSPQLLLNFVFNLPFDGPLYIHRISQILFFSMKDCVDYLISSCLVVFQKSGRMSLCKVSFLLLSDLVVFKYQDSIENALHILEGIIYPMINGCSNEQLVLFSLDTFKKVCSKQGIPEITVKYISHRMVSAIFNRLIDRDAFTLHYISRMCEVIIELSSPSTAKEFVFLRSFCSPDSIVDSDNSKIRMYLHSISSEYPSESVHKIFVLLYKEVNQLCTAELLGLIQHITPTVITWVNHSCLIKKLIAEEGLPEIPDTSVGLRVNNLLLKSWCSTEFALTMMNLSKHNQSSKPEWTEQLVLAWIAFNESVLQTSTNVQVTNFVLHNSSCLLNAYKSVSLEIFAHRYCQ